MEKVKLFLENLGVKPETVTQLFDEEAETDVPALANEVKTTFMDVAKNDATFVNELKAQAKKEGEIVATKKAKKIVADLMGVALSNAERDETELSDIVTKGYDSVKGSIGSDIEAERSKVIAVTNEMNAIKEKAEKDIEDIKLEYSNKEKQSKILDKVREFIRSKELIVTEDVALTVFNGQLASEGISIDIEENAFVPKKGGLKATKADNTGFESLETIGERALAQLIKRNNGNGVDANGKEVVIPGVDEDRFKGMPDAMVERIKQMEKVTAVEV